jgi:Tol biopolymer transport system component
MIEKSTLLSISAFIIMLILLAGCGGGEGDGEFPGGLPIERVNVSDSGEQGNGSCEISSLSSDGRYVAFDSNATNLVAGDENGVRDVFVFDRLERTIERVSVNSSGTEGNERSQDPSISGDGRYVAFESMATNLVTDDDNGQWDIFVYDRVGKGIEIVSVNGSGNEGNGYSLRSSISSYGRYVGFDSSATDLVPDDDNNRLDVFVYDRNNKSVALASVNVGGKVGDADSTRPSLSADGRYVAFQSNATDLVTDDTNGYADIFIYDRNTGTVERASVSDLGEVENGGSWEPSISADGRYVAFESEAENLVSGDTNMVDDIFVCDRNNDTLELVSISSGGIKGNEMSNLPSISGDGRYVVFQSLASNFIDSDDNEVRDVFVYDRQNNLLTLMSKSAEGALGDNGSGNASISMDGRYIGFMSHAANLVSGDYVAGSDIYVAPNE